MLTRTIVVAAVVAAFAAGSAVTAPRTRIRRQPIHVHAPVGRLDRDAGRRAQVSVDKAARTTARGHSSTAAVLASGDSASRARWRGAPLLLTQPLTRAVSEPVRPLTEQPKKPRFRGFSEERMKGLEPSTFCMARTLR